MSCTLASSTASHDMPGTGGFIAGVSTVLSATISRTRCGTVHVEGLDVRAPVVLVGLDRRGRMDAEAVVQQQLPVDAERRHAHLVEGGVHDVGVAVAGAMGDVEATSGPGGHQWLHTMVPCWRKNARLTSSRGADGCLAGLLDELLDVIGRGHAGVLQLRAQHADLAQQRAAVADSESLQTADGLLRVGRAGAHRPGERRVEHEEPADIGGVEGLARAQVGRQRARGTQGGRGTGRGPHLVVADRQEPADHVDALELAAEDHELVGLVPRHRPVDDAVDHEQPLEHPVQGDAGAGREGHPAGQREVGGVECLERVLGQGVAHRAGVGAGGGRPLRRSWRTRARCRRRP